MRGDREAKGLRAEETLQLAEEERVTFMFGIPIMFLLMTQVPEFQTADLSSIRFLIAGGSPCPRPLIETWLERGITFNQAYGMTDVLMASDKVADAGVIGIPDEKWGEVGLAVIVPAPGAEVTEEEIIEHCRGRLAKYKIPKSVVFVETLPRTVTGKMLKKELRAQYID